MQKICGLCETMYVPVSMPDRIMGLEFLTLLMNAWSICCEDPAPGLCRRTFGFRIWLLAGSLTSLESERSLDQSKFRAQPVKGFFFGSGGKQ